MIELRCSKCHSDLEIVYGQMCIMVRACERCEQELYNIAYEDGYEAGLGQPD